MPKETRLAARRQNGDTLLYHDSAYPSPSVVETFERYHPGAAEKILDMVGTDQRNSFVLSDRTSRLEMVTRILGLVFAFILTLAMICVGALLILKGHAITGCLSLFIGIISVIGTIATGGKSVKRTP